MTKNYQESFEQPTEQEGRIFELIWQEIKSWDINVPDEYQGYCGATGSHVIAILNAIKSELAAANARIAELEELALYWKKQTHTIHMAFNQMFKECNEADAELKIEKQRAEQAEARVTELEADRIVTCAYCGHEYPPGTPTSQNELLTEHIKVCEKHPMRQLEQQFGEYAKGAWEDKEYWRKKAEQAEAQCAALIEQVQKILECGGKDSGLCDVEPHRCSFLKFCFDSNLGTSLLEENRRMREVLDRLSKFTDYEATWQGMSMRRIATQALKGGA